MLCHLDPSGSRLGLGILLGTRALAEGLPGESCTQLENTCTSRVIVAMVAIRQQITRA